MGSPVRWARGTVRPRLLPGPLGQRAEFFAQRRQREVVQPLSGDQDQIPILGQVLLLEAKSRPQEALQLVATDGTPVVLADRQAQSRSDPGGILRGAWAADHRHPLAGSAYATVVDALEVALGLQALGRAQGCWGPVAHLASCAAANIVFSLFAGSWVVRRNCRKSCFAASSLPSASSTRPRL